MNRATKTILVILALALYVAASWMDTESGVYPRPTTTTATTTTTTIDQKGE